MPLSNYSHLFLAINILGSCLPIIAKMYLQSRKGNSMKLVLLLPKAIICAWVGIIMKLGSYHHKASKFCLKKLAEIE